jgi:hypothetical protein
VLKPLTRSYRVPEDCGNWSNSVREGKKAQGFYHPSRFAIPSGIPFTSKRTSMPDKKATNTPVKGDATVRKNIGEEIKLFLNQIDALADTLPLASLAIERVKLESHQQLGKFLKEECKVLKTEGSTTTYSFEGGQHLKYQRFARRVQKSQLAQLLVPRGLLVAVVSQFDAYVGGLIRQLFKLKPEIVDSSGRTLTFSQLAEFGSIEAARDYVIDKEIESVLRESHSEQFGWLEGKFNLPLRKDLPAWSLFIEITERRNLFVHTDGVVSRQYLEVCRTHACQVPDDVCVGYQLPLTREYFSTACECLLEIGVKLGQVLWRKIQPNEIETAEKNLIDVTYDLISEGRYQLARVLLDFATETLKTHPTESLRLRFVVNRAQTYKWTGDEEKCKQILNAEDWSATGPEFKLACAVLNGDFTETNRIVKQIGKDNAEVNKHAYREWPLFKDLRKSPEFIALFEQVFGEPLNKVTVQDTDAGGPTSPRVN